jgi:HD superfamily phosphodiesterase
MSDIYDAIYALAAPYWQTRSGEVHMPESYALAKQLLDAYPEADPAVVLPAILLHDIGYFGLPEETQMQGLSGSPRGWNPDVTRVHESAGARRAAEILAGLNYDLIKTAAIVRIIDGHDSRRAALSLEDALVKDADKLWRFTASGVRISRRWVGQEPAAFMDYVESKIDSWMLTEHGAAMARDILAATRRQYQEGEDAVERA